MTNSKDRTIKEIATEEGVTKHAISSRMRNIPNFKKKYTHVGVRNGQKCNLITPKGAKLLWKKSMSYRSISHGKSNSRTNSNDSYKTKVEKTSHELEEVKTGRRMLENELNITKQQYMESKKSMADLSDDRNHWRSVASSAQAQIVQNTAKDNKIRVLALQSLKDKYELKLRSRELPSSASPSTSSLKTENANLRARIKKLSKKHQSFWKRFF